MKINIESIIVALFLMTIIVNTYGCKPSLQQEIIKKINVFERNEKEYFEDIYLEVIRDGKYRKQLEYIVRYRNRDGRAIIQAKPKQIIYQNFIEDSIQMDFVKVVDTLNVRHLSNFNDTTHIEFWYDDDYVVLYRNYPIYRKSVYDKKRQFEVINDWRFFTFKLQAN
jgi:hypothetical protein